MKSPRDKACSESGKHLHYVSEYPLTGADLSCVTLVCREFTMAEIEHYVDPNDKSHPRFVDTKDVVLQLLPKDVQERGETTMTHMTVGDAVGQVSAPRSNRTHLPDMGIRRKLSIMKH
jgi:hypothetical protein